MSRTSLLQEIMNGDSESEELRREYESRRRRGRRTLVAAGLLFALGVALYLGSLYIATQVPPRQRPPLRRIMKCVALGLVSLPWYFGCRLLYYSRRCFAKNARLALLEDKRQPVLYLRAFAHDESQSRDFGRKWRNYHGIPVPHLERVRTEESLVKELSRCVGPVIAIGRPNEPLPELGPFGFTWVMMIGNARFLGR